MVANKISKHIMFKAVDDCPCVVWSTPFEKTDLTSPDGDRESAFADFPNISTPIELLDVYERLVYSPVPAQYEQGELNDVQKPEILLDMFGLASTRKNLNEAKDLLALASANTHPHMWAHLPVWECLTMPRDMKALLTVLAFSYGQCNVRALVLNTQRDFAFTYEFEEGESSYGDFLLQVREEDPNVLAFDHACIHEDIQKVVEAKGSKPSGEILRSMQNFAEGYINGFMWMVHPVLRGGKFFSMSKEYWLSDIYAYWAQRAAKGKILACANCGKLVANPRKNQMYCSKSCKVQACKRAD